MYLKSAAVGLGKKFETKFIQEKWPPKLMIAALAYLNETDSIKSMALKSKNSYPSRLKANTALGPSQISPFILGVKWNPKNGNLGSGTWNERSKIILKDPFHISS